MKYTTVAVELISRAAKRTSKSFRIPPFRLFNLKKKTNTQQSHRFISFIWIFSFLLTSSLKFNRKICLSILSWIQRYKFICMWFVRNEAILWQPKRNGRMNRSARWWWIPLFRSNTHTDTHTTPKRSFVTNEQLLKERDRILRRPPAAFHIPPPSLGSWQFFHEKKQPPWGAVRRKIDAIRSAVFAATGETPPRRFWIWTRLPSSGRLLNDIELRAI